jgi:hypothetical protein
MKTHPLNVSYLVVGLAFLGIAGSWALHQAGVIGSAEVELLLPLSLVVAGAIGLIAFMARSFGSGMKSDTAPTSTGYDTDYPDSPGSSADTEPTTYIDTEGDPR